TCVYWFFFFSSRRRHTRSKRDWSSDVCSSDLGDRGLGCDVAQVPPGQGDGDRDRAVEQPLQRAAEEEHGEVRGEGRDDRSDKDEIGRASCRERVEDWKGEGESKRKKKRENDER